MQNDVQQLASCESCCERFDATTAEYIQKDRSAEWLCLDCQKETLVRLFDPNEEQTRESVEIFPVSTAADRINDAWYWAYTQFNDTEYQRFKAEIDALPNASGDTVEELARTTQISMDALQAFYDRNHEALEDPKWRVYPVKFALTVEEVR